MSRGKRLLRPRREEVLTGHSPHLLYFASNEDAIKLYWGKGMQEAWGVKPQHGRQLLETIDVNVLPAFLTPHRTSFLHDIIKISRNRTKLEAGSGQNIALMIWNYGAMKFPLMDQERCFERGRSGSTTCPFSEGGGVFKSQTADRLFSLTSFVDFLISSMKMPAYYLKLVHSRLLPLFLQSIIH